MCRAGICDGPVVEGSPDDPVVVLGEIAHIVGESLDGPRGKSPLTLKQRNTYQNTILLCNQHHQLIDSDGALATYTVERLTAMKEDHEKWVERTLGGRRNVAAEPPPMVQDTGLQHAAAGSSDAAVHLRCAVSGRQGIRGPARRSP